MCWPGTVSFHVVSPKKKLEPWGLKLQHMCMSSCVCKVNGLLNKLSIVPVSAPPPQLTQEHILLLFLLFVTSHEKYYLSLGKLLSPLPCASAHPRWLHPLRHSRFNNWSYLILPISISICTYSHMGTGRHGCDREITGSNDAVFW